MLVCGVAVDFADFEFFLGGVEDDGAAGPGVEAVDASADIVGGVCEVDRAFGFGDFGSQGDE